MIDINKIVEDIDTVEIDDAETAEGYTPYAVAKVVNRLLLQLQVANKERSGVYQVPTQMMYQYAASGRINGVKGSKRYSEEDVETFVTKFVASARARMGTLA